MQVLTRVILGALLAAYGLAGFAAGDAAGTVALLRTAYEESGNRLDIGMMSSLVSQSIT